jgi:ABC-type thiamin/hydroxymethylpyrimidine transport system permease subunit
MPLGISKCVANPECERYRQEGDAVIWHVVTMLVRLLTNELVASLLLKLLVRLLHRR